MSKRWILAGSTDQTIDVFIQDSSSTTGAGLTGLTSATSGLTCYYRKGATGTPTALTLVSQTVTGAHADGGFVAVDGTNMPGVYRLDLSDTIVASAGMVTLFLRGAANMAQLPLEIEVVSVNPYDSAAFGLSRIDVDISSRLATSSYTTPPTSAAIADAVWDEATAGHTTAGTYGGQVLRGANSNVEVQVTGSNHVAADMHESQPGSIHATTFDAGAIDAAALATDAVAEIVSGVLTTQMTESYRATNAAPTLAQAAFELIAHMGEAGISGTTKTLKKLDGSTTAKTYTLDSSTTPTSITEAT